MVVAKIDEILPPGEDVSGVDLIEAPIAFIEKELKESAYYILRQAPVVQVMHVLKKADKHFPIGDPDTPLTNPDVRIFEGDTQNVYLVPCPVDLLRVINIKLSTWAVPVSELIPEQHPKYRQQKTIKWTRGTELKPKAALVAFSDYLEVEKHPSFKNIGFAIECFSSVSIPTLSYLHYVPKIKPEDMPDDLVDPMVWECAGRTLVIMNQPERAAIAMQQVQRFFTNKYGMMGE